MGAFLYFALFLVALNINESIQTCSSNEELVCTQKVCGESDSGLCACQCADGYYRDLETNECVNTVCHEHGGVGPVLFCTSNQTVICKERTCTLGDEVRCSCQCKDGFFKDPTSNTCVTECPD
ncbi:uncharacterized protein LOC143195554 [Rhynchophorus ferrugineus]|uniref:uncharacterized protein LOC143195554 n=1 Tax=Rhynchophorus ferrugineus TaxID=354439 RepID=UPI003FCCDC05